MKKLNQMPGTLEESSLRLLIIPSLPYLQGTTEFHTVGKRHTQTIERKHLTLRTRIKRLARRTICFSKSILMHDTVIGLFMNRYEFGLNV
jgi:IS1 family transposase